MLKMIKEEKVKKEMPLPTTEVEYMPKEIIPPLRLLNIVARINTILDGLAEVDLSQEDINEVKNDLTRIESSITNIEALIESKLKEVLIYKE